MNSIESYLRKTMKAQSNKHTTWTRVRSFFPNKITFQQMTKTSKPFFSSEMEGKDGKSGVELRNNENGSKGGMITQKQEKKVDFSDKSKLSSKEDYITQP